jgi:nucleoside-diphosphate-sugar epimerase
MEIKGKRVLVTGGTGCVGESVCALLTRLDPEEIVVIGRKKIQKRAEDTLKYLSGDICDYKFMEEQIKNTDILIHLAAKVHSMPNNDNEEKEFYNVNAYASEQIFLFAEKYNVKKVVFISTVAVFGDTGDKVVNEDYNCKPESAYGDSKLIAEKTLIKLCKKNSLPGTILRPTTVFGKNDIGNFTNLIKLLKKGLGIVVSGGENKKSFIYCKDVASAIIESIKNDNTNGKVYIISGFDIKVRDLIETVKDIFNIKLYTLSIPLFIINIVQIFNKIAYLRLMALARTNLYDSSKFYKETGFKYQYNLKNGLVDSFDYYDNLNYFKD